MKPFLASRLGLGSWFYSSTTLVVEEEKKPEEAEEKKQELKLVISTEDQPQFELWGKAVGAAELRQHIPSPSDALVAWSYGTESAEVCTVSPEPAEEKATLFLRTSLGAPDLAHRLNRDFFKERGFKVKGIEDAADKKDEPDYPVEPTEVQLTKEDDKSPVLFIEKAAEGNNYMYGNTLKLTSTTEETTSTLKHLETIFPSGFACIVPHDSVTTNVATVKGTMKLIRRTGVEKDKSSANTLATIFELDAGDGAKKFGQPEDQEEESRGVGENVVARCVLGYRDASCWPCVGPTVQSMVVRTDCQGSGLIQDLFNAVERWFVEFWTLDTRYWSRVFKATQLKDFVVDRAPEEEGVPYDRDNVVTDKIFFYEVMSFVVNVPHPSDPRGLLKSKLPPETEGIKFYPPTGTLVPLPTVYYSQRFMPQRWRSCDHCRAPEAALSSSLLVCGSCTVPVYWRAHYCSRECQRRDWGRHKLWCQKTYDEVCAGKKEFEDSRLVPC